MCTNFKIIDDNDRVTVGRTMDYSLMQTADLLFVPQQAIHGQNFFNPYLMNSEESTLFEYSDEQQENFQLVFDRNYSFIGMNAFGTELLTDGLNTAGLYVSVQTLNATKYQKITKPERGLSYTNFCNWALSGFATCEQVKEVLASGEVEIGNPGDPGEEKGLHFALHDATGQSMVVEVLDGEIQITDNSNIGVMTNDPPLPWHLANLDHYTALSPICVTTSLSGNIKKFATNTNHGTGLVGLPGSPLPSDRYIRAAMMVNYSKLNEKEKEAGNLAFHILNTLDIPYGVNKESDGDSDFVTYTVFASVSDLTNKQYTVRTYASPLTYSVDLNYLDSNVSTIVTLEVPKEPLSVDLTQSFQT